jgi:hypothetical protein
VPDRHAELVPAPCSMYNDCRQPEVWATHAPRARDRARMVRRRILPLMTCESKVDPSIDISPNEVEAPCLGLCHGVRRCARAGPPGARNPPCITYSVCALCRSPSIPGVCRGAPGPAEDEWPHCEWSDSKLGPWPRPDKAQGSLYGGGFRAPDATRGIRVGRKSFQQPNPWFSATGSGYAARATATDIAQPQGGVPVVPDCQRGHGAAALLFMGAFRPDLPSAPALFRWGRS